MTDWKIIEELICDGQNYLCKGHHFVKLLSKTDLQNPVELSFYEEKSNNEIVEGFVENIWKRLQFTQNSNEDINFIFTGSIANSSEIEQRKWFLTLLSMKSNRINNYFFNKKLKILKGIIDWFLTVYSIEGSEVVKGSFQHHLLLSGDPSYSNIQSTLVWFDHTLASKGTILYSVFKIFYVIAVGFEHPIINSTSKGMLDKRFISAERIRDAKNDLNNISRLLKQISFSETDVNNIFSLILSLLELSQYRAQGDGKKLEFLGTSHLKKAAEYLLVKEKQLRDFIINEYIWQDNKRKLKTPDIINYEIDAFIGSIYDVLINCILEKYNNFVEMDNKDGFIKINFFHSPLIPNFDKEKIFTYGDFYQYYLSRNIEEKVAENILEKVKIYNNFCPTKIHNLKQTITQQKSTEKLNGKKTIIQQKSTDSLNGKKTIIQEISTENKSSFEIIYQLLIEYKSSNNKSNYLEKLIKTELKEIQFFKINHRIFVDIFIPEIASFIRFDWESFVEGSEIKCFKQIRKFLQLSGNSVVQNYKIIKSTGQIWSKEEFHNLYWSIPAFNERTFFIHSLVDEENDQKTFQYTLKNQITRNNISYLRKSEITFDIILLEEFVRKYHVVFLNINEQNRTTKEAVLHGISRLQLTQAWCCDNFIHLPKEYINDIETLVDNYYKFVNKIQGYARIILAKIQLKNLKMLALTYKGEYLDAVAESVNMGHSFTKEYLPILNVDRENIDLKMISNLLPDQKTIEKLKCNEKNNIPWLNIHIMNKTSILIRKMFSSSKICLYYSENILPIVDNCFPLKTALPNALQSNIDNVFNLKICHEENDDVSVDVKTKLPLYVWNVETSINKTRRKSFPLSRGYLQSEHQYRIFSSEYFNKKLAYNILNEIPYKSFNELIQECSIAVILQPDPANGKCLIKSPLWILITNCLPLINLQSTKTFNLVEKEKRMIDKKECDQYVNGMHISPNTDWVMENLSSQLLLMSDKCNDIIVARDSIDSIGAGRLSKFKIQMEKGNFKMRKYINKFL